MIVSRKHKYIFIAVPKTGTSSIENFLLENDNSAIKKIPDKPHLKNHVSALEVRDSLGVETFQQYFVFGFIRHPMSRIVSSYFFYKKGAKSWLYESSKRRRSLSAKMRVTIAKLLPFKVWALIYPYKSNFQFLTDNDNKVIVSEIGFFENLNDDFFEIFTRLDLKFNKEELPKINKSSHDNVEKYFTSFFTYLLRLRHPKFEADMKFYQEVKLSKKYG